MSINGIFSQPLRPFRQETSADKTTQAPAAAQAKADTEGDVIDLKAIKAILYLGIRGKVSLPLEEGRVINTLA